MGQNGYYTFGRYRGRKAFRAWKREKNHWNFTSWTCKPGKTCGHWTQVSRAHTVLIPWVMQTETWWNSLPPTARCPSLKLTELMKHCRIPSVTVQAMRAAMQTQICLLTYSLPRVGPGHPSSPLSICFLIFFPFLLFSFFHWLYLFSSFVHPFPFYQNSPTPFPGRMSWKRPNLGLVCVLLCNLCYLYSLVKMDCGVLFYLV